MNSLFSSGIPTWIRNGPTGSGVAVPLVVNTFSTNVGGGTGTMSGDYNTISWSSGGWSPWTRLTGFGNQNPVGTWRWSGDPNPGWEFYADGVLRMVSTNYTWTKLT